MQNFTAGQLDRIQSMFAAEDSIPGAWIISLPAEKITGELVTEQLKDGCVTTPKLADDAVTKEKIADDSVTPAQLSGGYTGTFVAVDPTTGTSKTYVITNGMITAAQT